jgi:hypothetical protein
MFSRFASPRIVRSERYNDTTAQTLLSVAKTPPLTVQSTLVLMCPLGLTSLSAAGWLWSRGASNSQNQRFFHNEISASTVIGFCGSSATSSAPVASSVETAPYGVWGHYASTWDGGNTASTAIKLYGSQNGALLRAYTQQSTANGSGAATNEAASNVIIGNGINSDRGMNGHIAYVAKWNRVLSLAELQLAQTKGPLAVRNGLSLLWSNGKDYSQYQTQRVSSGGTYPTVGPGPTITFARLGSRRLLIPTESSASVFYYLGTDISAGGWTPSAGATLFGVLDETSPDDSDYAVSPLNPASAMMEVQFAGVQTPNSTSNHIVSYRIKGDGTTAMTITLWDPVYGVIDAWPHSPVPNSWTRYDQAISSANAANISNYSNLRLLVVAG